MKRVLLYGLRASGKTTIGKEIAKETGESFVDLDLFIVEKIGMDISHYVEINDWGAFRNLEYECLQEVLEGNYKIISLGGGTMEFCRNREVTSKFDIKMIYLHVDIKTQLERILKDEKGNKNRPNLTKNKSLRKELEEIYQKRHELYKDSASLIINSETSIDNIKDFIINLLKQ